MIENKVIRVAQIIGRTLNGGVENLIMNYYRNIDKDKVQFDFYVENLSEILNVREIEYYGGHVFIVPPIKKIFSYNKTLTKLLRNNNYDIIQSNMNSLSVFPLRIAKKNGYKIRIANSLSTSNSSEKIRNLIKNILKKFSKKYATDYFACSDLAAIWLFGKDIIESKHFYKIPNAIEESKYILSDKTRRDIRFKHNFDDNFVIGNIGRFESQKNQLFLLNVFSEIIKINSKSRLVIIGDGELEKVLKKRAKELNLKEQILILTSKDVGVGRDVAKYYSAFDCFVLPSLYEGLPTVGIEAQIASLPCFFASTITKEAKISEYAYFIDLDKSTKVWAKTIIERTNMLKRNSDFYCELYDINEQAKKLVCIYQKLLEEKT